MNSLPQDKRPLNRLRIGETARVSDLLSMGTMRRRLLDMGLVEGTRVECVQKSPAGGRRRLFDPRRGDRHPVGGFLQNPCFLSQNSQGGTFRPFFSSNDSKHE